MYLHRIYVWFWPILVVYHVKLMRLFFQLCRPNIPIMRLFSDDERATRFYGPPQLKV